MQLRVEMVHTLYVVIASVVHFLLHQLFEWESARVIPRGLPRYGYVCKQ